MKHKYILVSVVLLLFAMVSPAWAAGGHKLTDQELDQVAAGTFNMQLADNTVKFDFNRNVGGTQVSGSGTLDLQITPMNTGCGSASVCSVSSLFLSPGAQSGMRSLSNIVAVNSIVNVLLNLNVNIAQPGSTQNVWGISQNNSLAGLFH